MEKEMIDKDVINKLQQQLKCKEQECEELKENVEHWKIEHKEAKAKGEWAYDLVKKRLEKQLDKLKKTNEELKKENEKLTKNYFTVIQQRNKAEQTLADIEFWVRKILKRTEQVVPNEIRQILQKSENVR